MTLLEAAQGLFGAWRLLHFDRTGLQHFRATRAGFVNSFWAAAIVLPGDAIATLLFASANPGTFAGSSTARLISVYLLIYIIQWVLFPLAMAGLTEAVLRRERFVLFVVAHNWSSIVRMVIVLPAVAIFAAAGIGTDGWGAAIFFAALLATWAYTWYVARVALDTSSRVALLVVGLEIGIAIMLSWVTNGMT